VEQESILTAEAAALLQSPCSLIVGTVDVDGRPEAVRGWSFTLREGGSLGRLLLPDGGKTRHNLAMTKVVAVTGTDIPTNVSAQVKGRAVAVEAESADDRQRREAYTTDFLTLVELADEAPLAMIRRLVPASYFAAVFTIEDAFDQTPGPRAGCSLHEMSR
jgi:hypothetical protein